MHTPSMTTEEMAQLSQDMVHYAIRFLHDECLKPSVTNKLHAQLACLLCHYPPSPHHDLHDLGLLVIKTFYMHFLYNRCMNLPPKVSEAMRLYIRERFQQRANSPLDIHITPLALAYLENVLDPVLFPHNLRVLFGDVRCIHCAERALLCHSHTRVPCPQDQQVIHRFLEGQMLPLLQSAHKQRTSRLSRTEGLLRKLSQAQLDQLEQVHRTMRSDCRYWTNADILDRLHTDMQTANLALSVHAKLCLSLLSKDSDAVLLNDIKPYLHKENALRQELIHNAKTLIQKMHLPINTDALRL
jgi:hypothetical protein